MEHGREGSCTDPAHLRFEFQKGHLDRVQVGALRLLQFEGQDWRPVDGFPRETNQHPAWAAVAFFLCVEVVQHVASAQIQFW